VTNDILVFSQEIANLYSAVFKPILDIILFTNQLRHITGWQGPALMYSYFLVSAFFKKIVNGKAKFGRVRSSIHQTLAGRLAGTAQLDLRSTSNWSAYGSSWRKSRLSRERIVRRTND